MVEHVELVPFALYDLVVVRACVEALLLRFGRVDKEEQDDEEEEGARITADFHQGGRWVVSRAIEAWGVVGVVGVPGVSCQSHCTVMQPEPNCRDEAR